MRNTLTAVKVAKAKSGMLSDGGGLFIDRTESGGRWTYRYSLNGRRRDMGLGSYPEVSLADARKIRDKWAAVLRDGMDPIEERRKAPADDPTLAELVATVFDARKSGLRGEGERGRWLSPLAVHILPKLGARRVSTLHAADVRDVLKPIWRAKHVTATKAARRLTIILRSGKRQGLPCDPEIMEQAKEMLGHVQAAEVQIQATPWQDIPALYAKLNHGAASYQCLRWIILTAVRSTPARGARLDEIDGDVWTIPAERMKGNEGSVEPFRVPLCAEAMRMVEVQRSFSPTFLFPNNRGGSISETALRNALDVVKESGRIHGFRTSFRMWCQDHAKPFEVAETALAHVVGGETERAYARSDLLDQRRVLMAEWAEFVTSAA